MKPPPFDYVRPESLPDAVLALAAAGEDAKVLAGGQSLVPMLNFRLARPSVLVDIGRLPELAGIEHRDGTLVVGAGVRQRVAETSSLVWEFCPLIAQALHHVGHLQIRSRGTVGGSIAHADPAAELPAVALALDAQIVVRGAGGERTIGADGFFAGPYMTALTEDEIVASIHFPTRCGDRTLFLEYARRPGDFALAGIAFCLTLAPGDEAVASAALAAIGIGTTPVRLRETEAYLEGRELDESVTDAAGSVAAAEVDPASAGRIDSLYRKDLVAALVARGLKALAA